MCLDTARSSDREHTTEVRLYGRLGADFGRRHAFVIHTARQALNALIALKPGFAQALCTSHERAVRYAVFVGTTNLTPTDLDRPTDGQAVRIVPVVSGSKADGLWQTIGGVALFSAGAVSLFWGNPYAYHMMGLGASLALGGIAQMISPHLPAKSHPVLQAQNVVGEGGPVPLLYGRMRVGSVVISAASYARDAGARESIESSTGTLLDTQSAPDTHVTRSELNKSAPDTLVSRSEVEIVDLICEGPIEGLVDRHYPWHSAYFDGVPIADSRGGANFYVDKADFKVGAADDKAIDWLNTASCETAVDVQLRPKQLWTLHVNEPDVDEVAITLSVRELYRKDGKKGEQPWKIECALVLKPQGVGVEPIRRVISFEGLCRQQYQRTVLVSLGGSRAGHYEISLERLTPAETDHLGTVHVVCHAKRRNVSLRYPMSAVAAFRFDSQRMPRVPVRTYDVKGLLVSVPTNYDPIRREYHGVWDGSFRRAWTDNPAWVFYDLLLNQRYGAGNWVDAASVDRFSLYAIARYCDELVPDGRAASEPRFTCNCYITSRTHAFALLQQLASVFRGMAYWSGGTVMSVADMPQDPVHLYVPANVIDGEFRYLGSSLKTRYTVAMVSWHDPDNEYRECVECVEDIEGIERYGANKVEVSAFGCTSRGQAQRVGHWFLLTSRLETQTVVFSVGLDSVRAQPGQVIAVCDPACSPKSTGGRVSAAPSNTQITLDRAVKAGEAGAPEAPANGTVNFVMPDGGVQTRGIAHAQGATIELDEPLPAHPVGGAVWLHEPSGAERRLFRVVSVSESEDAARLTITATQHEPEKFAHVDRAAMIDLAPDPSQQVGPVRNLKAEPHQGKTWVSPPTLDVWWDKLDAAYEYEVTCLQDGKHKQVVRPGNDPHAFFREMTPGRWTVTVVAILFDHQRSVPGTIQVDLPHAS